MIGKMRVIEISGKTIKLSSGMTEDAFAKTRFASLITEKGVVAQADLPSENEITADFEPEFSFSDWSFDSIKSEADADGKSIVFYEGRFDFLTDDDCEPVTLADNWEEKASSHVKDATLICAAITYAAKNNLQLPQNGGGILISHGKSKITLIFLPEKIFFNSVAALNPELQSRYLGFYKNPILEGAASLAYMQAVITYKTLTGQFPFAKENENERLADITDKNFLPIEYAVEGIATEAADAINRAISQKNGGGQTDYSSLHKKLYKALFGSAAKAKNYSPEDSESFQKRAEEYIRMRNAQVERKRKLKRNSTKIIAAAVTLGILLMFVFSAIHSNADQPTTIGLSTTQVTECFFQSINQKDVQLMTAVTKGNAFKPYITAVTNMHVANAASQAYTFNSANVEPQKWFFYATDPVSDTKTSLYGISNLVIEGYHSLLDANTNKNKDKVSPACDESDAEGSSKKLELSYYIVQTDSESGEIEVEYAKGSVTLTLHKKRWLLTDINVTADALPFSTAEFKSDYFSALSYNQNNVISACEQLRFRYPWIPSKAVLEAEEEKLKEGFF